MKNNNKFLVIIALAAIMGLSMTSGLAAQNISKTWPANAVWERYTVTGGLRQPQRTRVAGVASVQGTFTVTLENANKAAFDDLINQVTAKSDWMLLYSNSESGNETRLYNTSEHRNFNITFLTNDRIISITIEDI